MKLFQKIYPLLGIILLLCSGIFFAQNFSKGNLADQALQRISITHLNVFGGENLFAEKAHLARKRYQAHEWDEMLDELYKLVVKDGDRDKKLLEAFGACQLVSSEIFGTLELVYDSVFARKKLPTHDTIFTGRKMIYQLLEKKHILEMESNELKGTSYYFWQKKKEGVKKVLLYLMLALEVTIDKVMKDFEKRLP